jgi:hypothetical protein
LKVETYEDPLIPSGIKAGILRREKVESCQSFVLEHRVNDYERADEYNVQDEYNGVPGRREQPDQWPPTYGRIQYSNRLDLEKK